MFDILNEVNKLSMLYKMKNISKFSIQLGMVYLISIFVFAYFISQGTNESGEAISLTISLVLISLVVFMSILGFGITVSRDSSYFYSYDKVQDMNEIEYRFIIENRLEMYTNIDAITRLLIKKFKNIDFLTNEVTVNYIKYIEDKEKQNNGDRWMLENYYSNLKIVEKFYKSPLVTKVG